MSPTYISPSLRRQIIADFRGRCAYCQTTTAVTGARLVIDHIIPTAVGGKTVRVNLCLACHACNEFKGALSRVQDSDTGEHVHLFHLRRQIWRQHFTWSRDGSLVLGLTAVGRATVDALNMNHLEIVEAHRRWVQIGWHPPKEDL